MYESRTTQDKTRQDKKQKYILLSRASSAQLIKLSPGESYYSLFFHITLHIAPMKSLHIGHVIPCTDTLLPHIHPQIQMLLEAGSLRSEILVLAPLVVLS